MPSELNVSSLTADSSFTIGRMINAELAGRCIARDLGSHIGGVSGANVSPSQPNAHDSIISDLVTTSRIHVSDPVRHWSQPFVPTRKNFNRLATATHGGGDGGGLFAEG
jgi:hypothetical protein